MTASRPLRWCLSGAGFGTRDGLTKGFRSHRHDDCEERRVTGEPGGDTQNMLVYCWLFVGSEVLSADVLSYMQVATCLFGVAALTWVDGRIAAFLAYCLLDIGIG